MITGPAYNFGYRFGQGLSDNKNLLLRPENIWGLGMGVTGHAVEVAQLHFAFLLSEDSRSMRGCEAEVRWDGAEGSIVP